MNKRLVVLIVVLLILTSSMSSFAITKEEASRWHYGNVSSWAKEELLDAVANGLVENASLFQDCKEDISRKEFSTLAVNLYREIKHEDPMPAPMNTFNDTTDTSVRIAYNLGIIKGVGDGKFAPEEPITREQMGVIMLNAVDALKLEYNPGDGKLVMEDKGNVSSWAIKGVDFVYENDFMKGDGKTFNPKNTTPVEQAVAIANRVYKKYATGEKPVEPEKPKEKDDYRKGYKITTEKDGIYAEFYNSGNKKQIVEYGKMYNFINEGSMSISDAKYVKVADDYEEFYFIDEDGNLISYNLRTDGFRNYEKHFGYISAYTIMEKGKYEGYYLVQEKDTNNIIAYDKNFKKVGPVYTLDENMAEGYIDTAINAAENFSFLVNDVKYSNYKTYGGQWERGNTLWMRSDSRSSGPIALAANAFGEPIIHNKMGSYGVEMIFNNEEHSNAGIVFNVVQPNVGNDKYTGYYVGIDPKNNFLVAGYSKNKWNELKRVELPFDVKPGETYNLEVKSGADLMMVYVDGENYLTVDTGVFNSTGYIGLRGWQADVEYQSFYAY